VDAGLFLPQPSLEQPLAAEMLVLRECLTHDGLGGRLGAAIESLVGRDVPFEVLPPGETDHQVLIARAQAEIVVPLWQSMSQVLDTFLTRPPDDAELRGAAARARLHLLAQVGRPTEWVRLMSRLAYRRADPDVVGRVLARLEAPQKLDVKAATSGFAATPLALAVVGGEPPAESSRLVQLVSDAVLPPEKVERLLPPSELAARRAEAVKYLERAVEALGGAMVLKELRGYREVVTSDTGVGPTVETETEFVGDGMRQTSRVLGTTITARIDRDGGTESSGERQVAISVDEARSRLAAAARHPLPLLSRWAKGEVDFRVVALRVVAGRELAVLEEVASGPDALRITIDTGASLIRAMEVQTWHPEAGTIRVREEFADYRRVGGRLRAPFLRTRSLDDGEPDHTLRTVSFEVVEVGQEQAK
jgi:hypothetical protein